MHELALVGSIAGIVRAKADGRDVRVVRLRIGDLRQVVPDTLAYCWRLVVEETPLAGCELEIERVPARLRCTDCSVEHDLGEELEMACPACLGTSVTVIAGEEFLVTSMDVATGVESPT